MPKKQNDKGKNGVDEIRDPSQVPKYLRRVGINVPAVEKKQRKARVPAELQKIEVAMANISNELKNDEPAISNEIATVSNETANISRRVRPATVMTAKKQKKETPKTKALRGPNKWQVHLKDFRAKNPGISYKQAMHDAKSSYTNI